MIISLISAFVVQPYVWLLIGIVLVILGAMQFAKYKFHNRGVYGIGTFIMGLFISLGQFLEFYMPLASIVTNFIGFISSIPLMIVFYYWKEGQKNKQVRIKQEKESVVVKEETLLEKLKFCYKIIKFFKDTGKDLSFWKRLGNAYVLADKEKNYVELKNAVDFHFIQEVQLNRNEYDQTKVN